MKKNVLKVLTAALAVTMMAGVFVGCGQKQQAQTPAGDNAAKTELSGTITATGSTALQPLADQVAKMFNEKNPKVTVNVQGGGSGTGLKDVAAGNAQLGNSDVFAEEKLPADQAKDLVDHKVAVVGFAAVTNNKVKVDNLTKQQLIDIFTGKITNWKEVGGDDMKIVILNRPASSGTRATFKKYALDNKEEATGSALTEDSSGAVAKALQQTEGGISYLASSFLSIGENKKNLKVLKFEGVEMSKDNITSGKYPIWSYEHMYTKGEAKDVTKAFLDYMGSSDVKATIDKLGYIPTVDMKVTR